jgi:hypothetical protein
MPRTMPTHAPAAPYAGTAPVTFIRLVRFRNITGIADEKSRVVLNREQKLWLRLSEIALALVRLDHVASGIVNADHSIM